MRGHRFTSRTRAARPDRPARPARPAPPPARADALEPRRLLAVAVQDLGVAVPDDASTAAVGTTLYFPGRTDAEGVELWRSDGTPAGTRLVKDLYPGVSGSSPVLLTAVGDLLYFGALTPSGPALWRSDGTVAGTYPLHSTGQVYPDKLAAAGDRIYFAAGDGSGTGRELWTSDGTPAGTRLVKDIYPGPLPSSPRYITGYRGLAVFMANDGNEGSGHGNEPWVSDGTESGTFLLKDILPGTGSSIGLMDWELREAGGRLYFGAADGVHGYELWSTDGTPPGTRMDADLRPGPSDSLPSPTLVIGDTLYSFTRDVPEYLYRTDGPTGRTTLVKRVSDTRALGPTHAAALDDSTDRFVFAAHSQANGVEPWLSAGEEHLTYMIADVNPGAADSLDDRVPIVAAAGRAFFVADDGTSGSELWSTEGTAANVARVADLAAGPGVGSRPRNLTAAGNKLFFTAYADGRPASDARTLLVATPTEPAPGTVSGTIFNDSDGDGQMAPWEGGLGGWKAFVDYTGFGWSPHFPYAVTAPDGTFTIENVRPGNYLVRTLPPEGWDWYAVGMPIRSVTVTSGQATTGVPLAVYVRYGDVVAHAYEDLDYDGTRDAGEPPVAGARFFSDGDHDGAEGPDEPSAVTGADGRAVFRGAIIGDHRITRVVPEGWSPTAPPVPYQDVRVEAGGTKEVAFGYARGAGTPGSITGTVYNDVDYDRARDAGEGGLAGRMVFIDDGNKWWDQGEPTAVTDANGRYTFANLAPGSYYLMLQQQFGWMQTSPVEGSHSPQYVVVTLAAGQGAAGRDFGATQANPGRISGTLYHDANRNGRRDTGEGPVPTQTGLYLDADDDGAFDNDEYLTISAPNGSYNFNNILPGTYTVRQQLRDGRDQTEPAGGNGSGHRVTMAPGGTTITNLNFGSVAAGTLGRISGFVFDDVNGNGARDAGEPSLVPGRVVYLDADNDGVLDAGERRFTTQVDGYWFDALAAGTYTVRAVVPPGMRQTLPASGAAHVVTLAQGQRVAGRDFGLAPLTGGTGTIGGTVYFDTDGSGSRGPSENSARDITVYLDADNDAVLDPAERSTRTDIAGSYAFAGLAPGPYVVRQVLQELQAQTEPSGRDALDRPVGRAVTVVAGQFHGNNDFGTTHSASLARAYGAVFDDANGNGVRDAGEAAPAGRVVYLDADNDGVLDDGERRVTQGAPGVSGYVFRDLLPGTYTVRALVPPGTAQSFPAGGGGHTFTVARFQTAGPFDFGLAPSPEPVTRPAAADAYVRDGSSAGNRYGAAAELQVKKSSSADLQREAYLRFDLSGLGGIGTAKLRLFGALQSASGESIAIAAYPSADVTWPENDVTWNTKPATGTAALSTATVTGTVNQWHEWDVTEYLRQQKAAGAGFVTFALKGVANSSAYVRFASDEAADAATRPQLVVEPAAGDTARPFVTGITVGGSQWAPEFVASLAARGLGVGGYAVPQPGAGAARTMPWAGADTITVRFSEDVHVDAADLRVFGAAGTIRTYRTFQYDRATFAATWTLDGPFAADRIRLEIEGDAPSGVADAAGNRLRGSGGGGSTSDHVVPFNALPGDADGDGVVNALDLSFVKQRLSRRATDPAPSTYSPFADLNGDGLTSALDVAALKQRLSTRLPAAPAPVTIAATTPFSSDLIDPHENTAAVLA